MQTERDLKGRIVSAWTRLVSFIWICTEFNDCVDPVNVLLQPFFCFASQGSYYPPGIKVTMLLSEKLHAVSGVWVGRVL